MNMIFPITIFKILFFSFLIQFFLTSPSYSKQCSLWFSHDDFQFDEIANHRTASQARGNKEAYIQGMNISTPNKLQLVQHYVETWYRSGFLDEGDRILDIGSGTGLLAIQLSEYYPDLKITGIDIDPEMISLSRKILSTYRSQSDDSPLENLEFSLHLGEDKYTNPDSVSVVIWSSVLHEIYSYSDSNSEAVVSSFENAYESLVPGGRILIRDFAAPENGDRLVLMRQSHKDPTDLSLENYQSLVEGTKRDFQYRRVKLGESDYKEDCDTFILPLKAAYNYMYRKDFKDNHRAEAYEDYAWASVGDVEKMLSETGFRNIRSETFVNDWIQTNRIEPFIEVFEYSDGQIKSQIDIDYQLFVTATK